MGLFVLKTTLKHPLSGSLHACVLSRRSPLAGRNHGEGIRMAVMPATRESRYLMKQP